MDHLPDTESILHLATGLVGVPEPTTEMPPELAAAIDEEVTGEFPAVVAADRLEEAKAALALEDDAESLASLAPAEFAGAVATT